MSAGTKGKVIAKKLKLQIKGGAANPSPPVGPALGAAGVNIMEFCKQFNARTQDAAGKLLRVIIFVYTDKTFEFVVKGSSVMVQVMETIKLKSGSSESNRKKVGTISWDQIRTIATSKMVDMNCFKIESAMKMIAGTARSMGVKVEGGNPPA